MSRSSIAACGLAVTLLALSPIHADELRWTAEQLFKKSVTKDLRLTANGIEIEDGELIEDDGPAAGFSYLPNVEKLSASVQIKKEFVIPNPAAKKATLLVGQGGDLKAIINGKPVPLELDGKTGNYWQKYNVPPDAFQKGKNEVVLHGAGSVWIARDEDFASGSKTRTKHPNRSAKSSDGGKTWDYDHLGPKGDIDGEYYVRLFLDHVRPNGTLTTPVLDVGNLSGTPIADAIEKLVPIALTAKSQGRVVFEARSGARPAVDDHWTKWEPLNEATFTPKGRYFQIRVELTGADPLKSPSLHKLAIKAEPKRTSDWTKNLRVGESSNPPLTRSSIPFEYEPFDHPTLKEIRTTFKLDEIANGAKDEFDLITRLAKWSASCWKHPGHIGKIYPPWNALEILKPHADGTPVGGFCQQYNILFLQACESFGIPARPISIGPGDYQSTIRGGHEVVEIWSNQYQKWIYIDGQAGWFARDPKTQTPLSLLDLRQRQQEFLKGNANANPEIVKFLETKHEWKGIDQWPPFAELRLIPRSNFLQEKAPLPLNQGMRGWFWTGHHVWTDSDSPASLLYSQRESRRENWEWSVNRTQIFLEATASPGELRVYLETDTPSFAGYFRGEAPIAADSIWKLQSGKNRFEVHSRNKLGRAGVPSWIEVQLP